MSQFDDFDDTDLDFDLDWNETPISNAHPPRSTSTSDLKDQLNQLQEKLQLNQLKPVRQPQNKELEIFLPPTVNSRDDQSLDFLGDLSDNLLVESRKLNFENKQLKSSIKSLNADNENMIIELNNLNLLNKELSRLEDSQNEKIWKCESDIENFKNELKLLTSNLNSKNTENVELAKNMETLKNSIDVLNNENNSLLKDSHSKIEKLNTQLLEFKESNDILNDENDILHKDIIDLKNQLEEIQQKEEEDIANESSFFTDIDDSIVVDPLPENLENLENIKNLDLDSLKSNLNLSIKQLSKLKFQNHKLKSELLKLKHQNNTNNDTSWNNFNDDSFNKKSPGMILPTSDDDDNNDDDESDILDGSSPINSRKSSFMNNKPNYILIIPKTTIFDINDINLSFFKKIKLPNEFSSQLLTGSEMKDDEYVNQFKLVNQTDYLGKDDLINNLNNEIKDLSQQNVDLIKSHQNEMGNLNKLLTEKDYKFQELETSIHEKSKQIDILTKLTNEKDNEINKLVKEHEITISDITNDHAVKFGNLQTSMSQSSSELKELKSTYENPSIDYIKSKSVNHNHIVISNEDHNDLKNNISQSTNKIAELQDFSTLQSDEIKSLKSQLESLKSDYESPSVDYIKSKSEIHNLITLDASKYESLLQRIESLQSKIKESDTHLALLTETLDALKIEKSNLDEKLSNPDIQYLTEKSTVLHYSLIPESEYIELKSNLTVLEAQLNEKENDYKSLQNIKQELQSNIIALEGKVTTLANSLKDSESNFTALQKTYDSPDLSYIKSKSSSLNILPVPIIEFNKLHDDNSSNLNKISELSAQIEKLESLNSQLTNKLSSKESNLDEITLKLNDIQKSHDVLSNQLENPDIDYIKSKASIHELTAIPMKEHDSLRDEIKSKDEKLKEANEIKQKLDLKHKEIQDLVKSKDELHRQIETVNHDLLSKESKLKELQLQIESPTLDYIKEKSTNHSFTLISNDEHENLNKQLIENSNLLNEKERELESINQIKLDLERQAEIQGMKTVSLELHESIQHDLNETKKDLDLHKQQIDELKQTEIKLIEKEKEISKLVKNTNELESKLAHLDEIKFELDNLKPVENELIEKRKELEILKANQLDMDEKLKTLLAKEKELENSLKVIESKDNEFNELKKSFDQPDLSYLEEKSKSIGYVPISFDDHNLSKSLLEESKQKAMELEDKVVELSTKNNELAETNLKLKENLSELNDLRGQLKSPNIDYIKEKSSNIGYIAIPMDDHNSLNERLDNLNIEVNSLKRKCEIIENEKVQLNEKIQHLEAIQASPPIEYIKSKSTLLGIIPVPIVEHDSLKSELQRKDILIKENNEKLIKLDNLKSESEDNQKLLAKKDAEIESHKAVLTEKESEIASHKQLLEDKENELCSHKKLLEDKENELSSRKSLLEDKENELTSHKTLLEDKENELTLHKTLLEEKENELTSHKTLLEDKEVDIDSHKKLLIEKNAEIDTNKQLLAAKETEINRHKAIVAEKDSKIEELSNSNESPSPEYILEKLRGFGFIPIPIGEHTSLKSEIQRKDELLQQNKQQLDELESLKIEVNEKQMQLSNTISKLDDLTKSYENPSFDYLKNKLNSLSYVVISESEFKEAELSKADSLTLLASLRDKLSAVERNLNEKDQELTQLGIKLRESKQSYEDEITKLKDELLVDENKLHKIAGDKGLAVVSLEDYQKGMNMQKSTSVATVTSENINDLSSQPMESIISVIENNGYTVLTSDEYNELKSKVDNMDLDDLANITHEMEDIESDIESKKHILEEMEINSRHSIISSSSSIRSSVVSVENILTQKSNALNDKISEIETSLNDLKEKRVKLNKQVNRLSVASVDLSTNLSTKLANKLTKISNEIEVKEIELISQQNALVAVEAYLDKSKDMNLPPVVSSPVHDHNDEYAFRLEEEIRELQDKYEEKRETLDSLKREISSTSEPSLLAERLSLLGYEIIKPSGESLVLRDIIIHNSRLSVHSLVSSNKFDSKLGTYNVDALIKEKGYSLLPNSEINKLKNNIISIEDIPIEDLKSRMKELGFVVLKNQEMKLLVAKGNEPKLPESFTVEQLQPYAAKVNMSLLSTADITQLKKRTVTSRELANKATELNLVLLSQDEVNALKKNEPITKENITSKGKEFDLLCIPSSQFVATTVSRTPDIPNVTVLPNTYYKILTKSHELYKKHKTEIQSSEQRSQSVSRHTIPEDDSFELDSFQPQTIQTDGMHLPGRNIDVISLHTIDTFISNKKEIMAAITQTIIGETLYKYYRKLGPFTSISDTRHARFFWVHPYSLTLYWSMVNPVMGNASKYPIKALSIVSVESIADNNPLPPGLYYKSIIIKSYDKSIKFTCPTRQIHNIWFNSLRYLLDKTSDSWVNDDDIENQYEQDFSLDKKTEIERSQSFRASRRSPPPIMSLRKTGGSFRSSTFR